MDQEQRNQQLLEPLEDLLGRVDGCNQPDCNLCLSIKARVLLVGELLEMTPEQIFKIMPRHLRGQTWTQNK